MCAPFAPFRSCFPRARIIPRRLRFAEKFSCRGRVLKPSISNARRAKKHSLPTPAMPLQERSRARIRPSWHSASWTLTSTNSMPPTMPLRATMRVFRRRAVGASKFPKPPAWRIRLTRSSNSLTIGTRCARNSPWQRTESF